MAAATICSDSLLEKSKWKLEWGNTSHGSEGVVLSRLSCPEYLGMVDGAKGSLHTC